VVATSYSSLGELRGAVQGPGLACERFEVKPGLFEELLGKTSDSGSCNDDGFMYLTQYSDLDAMQRSLDRETVGSGWDDPVLVGPNWEIAMSTPEQITDLQTKLGGTQLKGLKPR